jgi:hypothetical protein
MTFDEPDSPVEVVEDDFITITLAIHESETDSLRAVLGLIDGTLSDIGRTSICSSSEITDHLLDMRNIISPIVESRA